MAKTKALISCAVTAQLICVFVFAYANCWFSHAKAHLSFPQAYWPFDDGRCYTTYTDAGETVINMPTQRNIWAWKGGYTWNFLIDFTNNDKYAYGNWPRGTCSGPYSLSKYNYLMGEAGGGGGSSGVTWELGGGGLYMELSYRLCQ